MKNNRPKDQNQRIERITEQTIVIGVDIAKSNHVARAFTYRGLELGKRCLFTNDEAGLLRLLEWAGALRTETSPDLLLGVEPTGHYWFPLFHFLTSRGVSVVLVNPHHVKKSKELDDNSPTKNDIKDAKVIAKLVLDGRYSIPQLLDGVYADLRGLMRQYERLGTDLTRVRNRIHNVLDRIFPEYTQVFKDWEGKTSLVTLKHLPLPQDVVRVDRDAIVRLWRENNVQGGIGHKRAAQLQEAAARSIGLIAGAKAARQELAMDLAQYELLVKQIAQVLEVVQQTAATIPGVEEMLSVPGIGLITVAGFLAEIGDLHGYDHSQQIVRHAGLNLREDSSGKHKGATVISKRGRRGLRKLLYWAALTLVRSNPEFRAWYTYYQKRPNNPLKKKQALIVLSVKLIRILFELGRRRIAYDPGRMSVPSCPVELNAA